METLIYLCDFKISPIYLMIQNKEGKIIMEIWYFLGVCFFIKKQGNKYIIQLIKMGNQQNSNPQLFAYLKDTKNGDLNQKEYPFIVKQILAQSPQNHQQLITTITRLKQQKNEYFVKVIDSHTVQTHHLCSIISHIYVLMQKPSHTLNSFAKKLEEQGLSFQNQEIISILTAFGKVCQSLKEEGEELMEVNQSIIFVNQVGHRQIHTKVMHPFFTDSCMEKQQNESLQKQLASLILSLKLQISQDLYKFLVLMAEDKISLKEVTDRLSEHHKRSKSGLQLMKHISKEPKLGRQSINSLASNGQSLMINGGDVSELMFKDFYEHFDNSISQIEMRSMDGDLLSEIIVDQEISHRFPKRYLRSKAFKKTNKREGYSEWSEKCSQKHNITRDQSMKDNFRRQQKNYLFGSAKLVESFVSELHHQ